jgi:hypothetical protein
MIKSIVLIALAFNLIGFNLSAAMIFKEKVDVAELSSDDLGLPDLAIGRNNNIYVVWFEQNRGVFLSRSIDGGLSFEKKVHLDQELSGISSPEVAIGADGSIIVMYLAAKCADFDGNISVIMKRSFDNGLSFQTDVIFEISNNAINISTGFISDLQVNQGDICYIWNNANALYFSMSKDMGENFKTITINETVNTSSVSKDPVVSLQSDGSVFALHYECESGPDYEGNRCDLYFSKLENNGNVFSDSKLIAKTDSFAGFTTQGSIITTTEDQTYLIWNHSPTYRSLGKEAPIFYTHSEDGGENFGQNNEICFDGGTCYEVIWKILIDQQNAIHFLYTTYGGGLAYRKSSDLLQTFGKEIIVTDNEADVFPDMVINAAGDLFVAWLETSGDDNLPRICFSRSIDTADGDHQNDSNIFDDDGSSDGCFLKAIFEKND